MIPIRNSYLNGLRNKLLGTGVDKKFIEVYLQNGSLLDALLTEPDTVNHNLLMIRKSSFYGEEAFYFEREMWDTMITLRDIFLDDPMAGAFYRSGFKHTFDSSLTLQENGKELFIPTSGELDLSTKFRFGSDIKVTTSETRASFINTIGVLHYDQQAAYYMDNTGLDRFVIFGLSRKAMKIFPIVIDRDSILYKRGRDRYRYWILKYIKHNDLYDSCLPIAA